MEKIGGYLRRYTVQEGEGRDLVSALQSKLPLLGFKDFEIDDKTKVVSYSHDPQTRVRIIPRQKNYMIIIRGNYMGSAEALCDLRNVGGLRTLADVPKPVPKGPLRGGKATLYRGR